MKLENCKVVGEGISYKDYSAQTVKRGDTKFVMSRSELIEFAECPEKYVEGTPENPDTPATIFGRLVECLETAPEDFENRFVIHPDTYPPQGKDWTRRAHYCSDWETEQINAGLTVISPKLYTEAGIAVKNAQRYQPRTDLIACSKKQVMVIGNAQIGDVSIPLRCLLDLVPDKNHPLYGRWIADAKTARNGNPNNFDRVIDEEGYDIQAALGMDLYIGATGEDRTDWIFPLQENIKPYHVVKPMPALTSEFMAWGRAKYQSALQYYALCLTTKKWPSYPSKGFVMGGIQYLGPENLWSYKQTGGNAAAMEDYRPAPKTDESKNDQGIIP